MQCIVYYSMMRPCFIPPSLYPASEQDPLDSTLILYNSHVLSYFRVCNANQSVLVHCTYGGHSCNDYAETMNFMEDNSTCLQITFHHQKEEVVNGTEIRLVITNATTLKEIGSLSRMFLLVVVNDTGKQISALNEVSWNL